jgi:hypothetical protein
MSATAPSASEVRDALERVLGSAHLKSEGSLCSLLRSLVEGALGGSRTAPGKRASEAQIEKLRTLLTQYYESAGLYEPVRIDITKDGGRPVFTLCATASVVRPEMGPAAAPSPWAIDQPHTRRRLLLLIAAASVILAIALVMLVFRR